MKKAQREVHMMNIVDIIIECYETGTSKDLYLQEHSSRDVRVVMIELLTWLKLEHKREVWINDGKKTNLKPLLLNDNYPWCRDLKSIIAKENILSQYFSIIGDEFDFADSIPEEYRMRARVRAFEYYNPQKRS